MLDSRKALGNYGEDIAVDFLKESNFIILERNFRCHIGEIDIIAKDAEYICFIEVKTRCNTKFGTPREAVDIVKQHKICKTAQYYIMKKKLFKYNFRFDVIEIILKDKTDGIYDLKLIKNAFIE